MGTFDTVRVEYPLPEPTLQNAEFQTKDLDEALCRYTITIDGRLLRYRHPVDFFGDEASQPAETTSADTEEIAHHGDIRIYTFDDRNDQIEFTVRFTHGRVEWIRPTSETPQNDRNPASVAALADFLDRLEEERVRIESDLLMQIEKLDPEIVSEAVLVFDDRGNAAKWLSWPNRALGDISPLRVLAKGNREAVLDILERIKYGIYS